MSIKDQFSDDEWFLLSSTPAMIGAAMSSAAPSGVIGTVKEMTASMRGTVQALNDYPHSVLISALLEKSENWEEAKEKMQDYREKSKARLAGANIGSHEQLQAQVLKDCATAAQLVNEKCTAEEAAVYKEWSIKIARSVAEAAKEGGFLGFGGERVSEEEALLIQKIEAALGVPVAHLLA